MLSLEPRLREALEWAVRRYIPIARGCGCGVVYDGAAWQRMPDSQLDPIGALLLYEQPAPPGEDFDAGRCAAQSLGVTEEEIRHLLLGWDGEGFGGSDADLVAQDWQDLGRRLAADYACLDDEVAPGA
jgi:hypothetical protein